MNPDHAAAARAWLKQWDFPPSIVTSLASLLAETAAAARRETLEQICDWLEGEKLESPLGAVSVEWNEDLSAIIARIRAGDAAETSSEVQKGRASTGAVPSSIVVS